jgi:hypothetical protein
MKYRLQNRTVERPHPGNFRLMQENKIRDHLARYSWNRWKPRSSVSPCASETTFISGHKGNSDDFYQRGR